jgi:hypothetical protein
MIFRTTLDGLATRNTVGSERDARETQHCEPWGPLSWPLSGGVKPRKRPRSDAYKVPVTSLSLSSCVVLYFSQSTHSLLQTGDLIFDGFRVLPTADSYPLQTHLQLGFSVV